MTIVRHDGTLIENVGKIVLKSAGKLLPFYEYSYPLIGQKDPAAKVTGTITADKVRMIVS